MAAMPLRLAPITLQGANDYVRWKHRHHGPTAGHKFSISVIDDVTNRRVGVAIVGRPVARHLDDGWHLEVLRVATDGTPNACSMLYGACARAGVAMGYPRWCIITYILESESGSSLTAAGWVLDLESAGGGSWSVPSRPRVDKAPIEGKRRYRAGG